MMGHRRFLPMSRARVSEPKRSLLKGFHASVMSAARRRPTDEAVRGGVRELGYIKGAEALLAVALLAVPTASLAQEPSSETGLLPMRTDPWMKDITSFR